MNEIRVYLRLSLTNLLLASLVAGCAATAPGTSVEERPLIPLLDAKQVAERCDAGLADARARIARMEQGVADYVAHLQTT